MKKIPMAMCAAGVMLLLANIIMMGILMFKASTFPELPEQYIDLQTGMIGVMAAFMGLCITLLVGVQIYDAIEIEKCKKEIRDTEPQVVNATATVFQIYAETLYNEQKYVAAFLYQMLSVHSALFAKEINGRYDVYASLQVLRNYASKAVERIKKGGLAAITSEDCDIAEIREAISNAEKIAGRINLKEDVLKITEDFKHLLDKTEKKKR